MSRFNASPTAYTGCDITKRKRRAPWKDFTPKVCFIRQAREDGFAGKGMIVVLNKTVCFARRYVNCFILAEWALVEQRLHVWFEKNRQPG